MFDLDQGPERKLAYEMVQQGSSWVEISIHHWHSLKCAKYFTIFVYAFPLFCAVCHMYNYLPAGQKLCVSKVQWVPGSLRIIMFP